MTVAVSARGFDAPAPRHRTEWPARVAISAVLAGLCLGAPALPLLDALAPSQSAVFAALMPEYEIRSFAVEQRGAQLELRATTDNRSFLIVRGRALPPGLRFDVRTPARAALVHAALIIAGVALTVRPTRRAARRALVVAGPATAFMVVVAPAVLLAGAQCGLVVAAFEDPSLAALLVGAAKFLAHGGGYALCIGTVVAATSMSSSTPSTSGSEARIDIRRRIPM